MKIPLNDPIWRRLYGPYGVQNVNQTLVALQSKWDTKLANDLYWERLHHQDDTYPVTYAALPWLWDMMPDDNKAKIDLFCFLSHVIYCSEPCERAMVPCGKFKGLSLAISKHAHPWLDQKERLEPKDKAILAALENWFDHHQNVIAEEALSATKDVDGATSVHLCSGFLCLRKADKVMSAMGFWQNEEEMDVILQEAPPSEADISAIRAVLSRLQDSDRALTNFLTEWLSELDIAYSDNPDQLTLI